MILITSLSLDRDFRVRCCLVFRYDTSELSEREMENRVCLSCPSPLTVDWLRSFARSLFKVVLLTRWSVLWLTVLYCGHRAIVHIDAALNSRAHVNHVTVSRVARAFSSRSDDTVQPKCLLSRTAQNVCCYLAIHTRHGDVNNRPKHCTPTVCSYLTVTDRYW